MKCPMIKKCGGCFYPQDQYQEELKEKTLFIEKEVQKAKLKTRRLTMSDIAEAVGKRIYAIRTSKHMSRKDLAKRSGLHLTYIGQLERGERNATIATLESVSYALNVPIERFVEYITPGMASQETAANECYNLILEQTPRTQKRLLAILQNMAQLHQIQ